MAGLSVKKVMGLGIRLSCANLVFGVALASAGCQFGTSDMAAGTDIAPYSPPVVTASERSLLSDIPNALDMAHNGTVPEQIAQFGNSGPGIVVCSPVVSSGDQTLVNFAEGCAQWLQIEDGGQPEFGRTPSWSASIRAATELHQSGLHLTAAQAMQLKQICGATDAAVGSLTSTAPGQYQLSYSVVTTADGKPVGSEIDASGSRDDIVRQLPTVATTIAQRLGLSKPTISTSTDSSADEIAFLGHIYWETDTLSDAERKQVAGLAQRPGDGFAAMENVENGISYSTVKCQALVNQVLKDLPGNAEADNEVSGRYGTLLSSAQQSILNNDLTLHPHTYDFAAPMALRLRWANAAPRLQALAAINAVDCNTSNPGGWMVVAETFSAMADNIRQCRTAEGLNRTQWTQLSTLYPYWLGCYERAAHLDPMFNTAWSEIASAATFVSYTEEADAAERHALALGNNLSDDYSWAMQMYAPKWGGDPAKIDAASKMAATDPRLLPDGIIYAAESLNPTDYPSQHTMLENAAIARLNPQITADPGNPRLHEWLGDAYAGLNNTYSAKREYQTASLLDPVNADLHFKLADYAYNMGLHSVAFTHYKAALAIDPYFPKGHAGLGYCYKEAGKYPQAEAELRKDIALTGGSARTFGGLADVYAFDKKLPQAAPLFEKAAELQPFNENYWDSAAYCFDNTGQYNKAISVIKQGLSFKLDDSSLLGTLEDVYLKLKQPDKTIAVATHDLSFDTNTEYASLSTENLAEAYLAKHQIAEAQLEWQKVLTYSYPALSAVAAKFLVKYPVKTAAKAVPPPA